MKILATAVIVLFSAATAFSSAAPAMGEVPKKVKEAFARAYPDAQDVEWEEEDGNYEVEFELNGFEMESLFSATGEELKTVVEIDGVELPKVVFDQLQRQYAGWKIEDVDREEHHGNEVYEIEVEHEDGRELELLYSSDGRLISKEVEDRD